MDRMRRLHWLIFFTVALSEIPGSVSAQVVSDSLRSSAAAPFRDPHLARQLAIVPGLGYAYTGEYLRGFGTWVATIGGLGMGPVFFQMDNCTFAFLSACTPRPNTAFKILGLFLMVGGAATWVGSYLDAPHAAERANERHLRPVLTPPGALGSSWHLGLSF